MKMWSYLLGKLNPQWQQDLLEANLQEAILAAMEMLKEEGFQCSIAVEALKPRIGVRVVNDSLFRDLVFWVEGGNILYRTTEPTIFLGHPFEVDDLYYSDPKPVYLYDAVWQGLTWGIATVLSSDPEFGKAKEPCWVYPD